jgi:hypothetical protein
MVTNHLWEEVLYNELRDVYIRHTSDLVMHDITVVVWKLSECV